MGIIGEVTKEALGRFPDTPTKTLARKLYKENPSVFKELEFARRAVRYYRGKSGKKDRLKVTDKKHFRESFDKKIFDDLPEELQDYKDWGHYELPNGKWLIIADAHIPYYRKRPFEIALEYGAQEDVDGIVLFGDIADFYSISFWVRDPRRRNFKADRDALLQALGVIRNIFPDKPIVYKLGNHEERLERYLRVKAPELIDMELLSFSAVIESDKYNIDVVDDKRIIKIGRLYMIHGHEFGHTIQNPVNPARGLYLRGKEIALCAHYHQTSQHTEKSLADIITSCWSIGCLCDLHPEYRPLNKWNHGFAIVDNKGGEFKVSNKRIINGQVY